MQRVPLLQGCMVRTRLGRVTAGEKCGGENGECISRLFPEAVRSKLRYFYWTLQKGAT